MDSFESYDSLDSDYQRDEMQQVFEAFEREALIALEVFRIDENVNEPPEPSRLFTQVWPCRCCEPIGQSCLCSDPVSWDSGPSQRPVNKLVSKLRSRFARFIKRKPT